MVAAGEGADPELSEHVAENRRYWDTAAPDWVAAGRKAWSVPVGQEYWGSWEVPESELRLLPTDLTGIAAIELGCGTGYVSAWLARRGASVLGIDNSAQQLATARSLHDEHAAESLDITWSHGNAEQVDRPDGTFDLAWSEYGAAIWCDPRLWIPEAHRLLRPGGRLVFLGTHPLLMAVQPLDGSVPDPTSRLLSRPWFGSHAYDWREADDEPGGIEFNLSLHDWFALFLEVGFEVEHFQEVRAPADATGKAFVTSADWARDFPSEQVFHLRRVG